MAIPSDALTFGFFYSGDQVVRPGGSSCKLHSEKKPKMQKKGPESPGFAMTSHCPLVTYLMLGFGLTLAAVGNSFVLLNQSEGEREGGREGCTFLHQRIERS